MFKARFNSLTWYRENVPCMQACPVHTDSGRYVQLIAQGRIRGGLPGRALVEPVGLGLRTGLCRSVRRRLPSEAGSTSAVTIRPLKRFVTENWGAESARPESYRKLMEV